MYVMYLHFWLPLKLLGTCVGVLLAVLVFFLRQNTLLASCFVQSPFLTEEPGELIKMCIVDVDRKFDFCPLIICLSVLAIHVG